MKAPVLVIGGGGHAGVILDILMDDAAVDVRGILDCNVALHGTAQFGVPVLGSDEDLSLYAHTGITHFAMGIGCGKDNRPRELGFQRALAAGLTPYPLRHWSCICSSHAVVGPGCQLLAGSIIAANAILEENIIINHGAIVDHDCHVGSHTHISPRACLCGGVWIGNHCVIGAGAVIKPCVRIGNGAVVGAGAVVLHNVAENTVVMGVPAHPRAYDV